MMPYLRNAGIILFVGVGSLVLAASMIGEAVTDWRRQKHGGISWN